MAVDGWGQRLRKQGDYIGTLRKLIDSSDVGIGQGCLGDPTTDLRSQQIDVVRKDQSPGGVSEKKLEFGEDVHALERPAATASHASIHAHELDAVSGLALVHKVVV